MRYLFLFLILAPMGVFGQYHLSEIGFKAGVGPAVPVLVKTELNVIQDGVNASVGFGHNAGGFFSHWICGKSYGYQFELGYRGQINRSFVYPVGPDVPYYEPTDYFGFVDIGAFLKWRPQNYHRDKEWNLVIGPKLNILAIAPESETFSISETDYNRFQPALHASVWFRFPWTKRRHWFLSPGVDFLPLNIGTTRSGATFSTVYPHLSFGMTLYNTK